MKKITLLVTALFASTLFFACSNSTSTEETEATEAAGLKDGTVNLDLSTSTVSWKGVMLGVKEHTGTVNLKAGSLEVAEGKIVGGSFTADLTSIVPTDSTYDEKSTREKLVGHLSSPDFFNTAEFPEATFVVKSATESAVTGDLTIRGITHEATVENVVINAVSDAVNISGNLVFNRKDFEVSFDVPMKDMVISDDIELDINLVVAQ